MKANPSLALCEYLNLLGASCEVSSKNELLTAIKAGFEPNKIIFVGPGKKADELECAIAQKIKSIVCESIDEIMLINIISEKYDIKTPILVRINPDFFVASAPIKMSGLATQFGIETSVFIENRDEIKKCNSILLEGIQVYNASRVLDSNAILTNIENILKLAEFLSVLFDIKWKTIDLGGGFGIPYFKNEKSIDIIELTNSVNQLIDNYKILHADVLFIFELGRYLVSESGYLISTVQFVKTSHKKNYIIIDSGMHCHLAASGLGSFVHRNFEARLISNDDNSRSDKKTIYQVVGPLCTPGDLILKDIEFFNVKKGDFIVIGNTGAYGLTASPSRFLSHGAAGEIIYHNNVFYLSRRKEFLDDILSTQNSLKAIY